MFGRGAIDNKGDLAMVTAAAIGLKEKGWVPSRDIVLLFTGDEETQMQTTQAAAKALSNAALVLNADAGGGELAEDGTAFVYGVQAGREDLCRLQAYRHRSGRPFEPPRRHQRHRLDEPGAGESGRLPLRAQAQPAHQGLSRRSRRAAGRSRYPPPP